MKLLLFLPVLGIPQILKALFRTLSCFVCASCVVQAIFSLTYTFSKLFSFQTFSHI